MKSTIMDEIAELAPLEAIARLEQLYNQLKIGSQSPTIYDSSIGSISITVPAPASNVSFSHLITSTLTTTQGNPVLYAHPLWSMFLQDVANPLQANLFPFDGGNWAGSNKKYEDIVDLNYWMSYGRSNKHNLVAAAHVRRDDHGAIGIAEADNNPDGSTSGSVALDLYVQWRYLRPGS